jgi:predicted AlkP superfamily pyrophosphatase or phosphodiesterase
MRSLLFFVLLFLLFSTEGRAQQDTPERPKLIVGIVVDQMRFDYLYRYRDSYGPGGFKRLLQEGFSCANTHYNYMPTYTGPGHAAIYTGTTPSVNGVIANDWWDRSPAWRSNRYVTRDKAYHTTGGSIGKVGQHSPRVLLSSTITDELRLSNNFKSKVVGVCLKDRGSILPAGHIPDACFWFDDTTGNWITSTYYANAANFPQWAKTFNDRRLARAYIDQDWEKIPDHRYDQSYRNWKPYEHAKYLDFPGDLPYDLDTLRRRKGTFEVLRFTPFGNALTVEFAKTVLTNMELGADEHPDMLCVSFSSPDYCAHQFGIHAEETEDLYIKLDLEIADFLTFLDEKVGKNNVLVFLTADHGGSETPAHLKTLRIPSGVFPEAKLKERLEKTIAKQTNTKGNFISTISNQQIWLQKDSIANAKLQVHDIENIIKAAVIDSPGVYDILTREEVRQLPDDYPFAPELRRGIHPHRSGDLFILLDPAWHAEDEYFSTGGATHGSPYPYDTHVPLLWYGWRVRPGETFAPISITDIAPTLASMLRIMAPNGCTGQVIQDLMPPSRN